MAEWEYIVARTPDIPRLIDEGWELAGYDPRYIVAFGSLWMRRKV